jgi:hypothetical protein
MVGWYGNPYQPMDFKNLKKKSGNQKSLDIFAKSLWFPIKNPQARVWIKKSIENLYSSLAYGLFRFQLRGLCCWSWKTGHGSPRRLSSVTGVCVLIGSHGYGARLARRPDHMAISYQSINQVRQATNQFISYRNPQINHSVTVIYTSINQLP